MQNFFSRKKSTSSEKDIENGAGSQTSATAAERNPHLHTGRPDIDPTDHLNLFRHLVGITSHESMQSSELRPASNVGIYTRVVTNEAKSKRGYKYLSLLINGCLGLQIVVAASLTAMGAGGARRSFVTVFGAINTVIAGILTFLKGSGLPNRLKYYQMEWRRIREFIEQRERDLSQPGNDLDIYAVVAMIEAMYDEVKHDLDVSTPERFAGGGRSKQHQVERPAANNGGGVVATPGISDKLKGLESRLAKEADERSKQMANRAEGAITGVESQLEDQIKNLASKARTYAKDFQK